jgi:hypothetical protein
VNPPRPGARTPDDPPQVRKNIFVCQRKHSLELSGSLVEFKSLTGAFRWVLRPN